MSKIYYNVKQFKNALATGLLGLATLGPMTSCEKNEPDNFNQKETVIDKGKADSEDLKINQGQEGNNGGVSEDDVLYGDYEGVTGNTYGYLYKDGTYRTDEIVINENGTFLNCFITVVVKDDEGNEKGKTYEIDFKKINDKGDLELFYHFPNKENTLDIFNKYRIEDKYYTERGFNPPV